MDYVKFTASTQKIRNQPYWNSDKLKDNHALKDSINCRSFSNWESVCSFLSWHHVSKHCQCI